MLASVFRGKKKVDKLFVPLDPIGRISVTLHASLESGCLWSHDLFSHFLDLINLFEDYWNQGLGINDIWS